VGSAGGSSGAAAGGSSGALVSEGTTSASCGLWSVSLLLMAALTVMA